MPTFLHIPSPIGLLHLHIGEGEVLKLGFGPSPLGSPAQGELPERCRQDLVRYFDGERPAFDWPLALAEAPPFHRQVWALLRQVPYGTATTYAALARQLGQPGAARAVGQANARNPFMIVVPCHRVVATDGHLHGYAYGLDVKAALLQHENPQRFPRQASLF